MKTQKEIEDKCQALIKIQNDLGAKEEKLMLESGDDVSMDGWLSPDEYKTLEKLDIKITMLQWILNDKPE